MYSTAMLEEFRFLGAFNTLAEETLESQIS